MEGSRIFLGLALITIAHALRERRRYERCPFDNLKIPHGWYTFTDIFQAEVEYTCDAGFYRYGKKTLYCLDSSWTGPPPKCITNTCQEILAEDPLRVERKHNGSLLRFSCAVMNRLEGTERITCDGSMWSDTVPKCIPFTPATNCDFEERTLCGWDHHDDTNVKWRRHMGVTGTERTGPDYDHTYGSAGNDVAELEVYIKPESKDLDELPCTEFSVKENKGENWLNHTILVSNVSEPFQIAFVATKGTSFRSDIAIDDVMLYECPEHFPTTTTSSPTIRTSLRTFAQSPKTSTSPTSSSISYKQNYSALLCILFLLCSNCLFYGWRPFK